MNHALAPALTLAAAASIASAGLPAYTVDFDSLPVGPSLYIDAGPVQTLGFASDQIIFDGGVILGFPTSFPAVDFATEPNVYGSSNFGDPSLSDILTIEIDGFGVNQVQGLLFNGEIQANEFEVRAYDSFGALLDSEIYFIESNLDSGAVVFSMNSDMPNIARVEFNEFNSDGEWNMLLDTITFNRDIPAPGTLLAFAALGLTASRRRRA